MDPARFSGLRRFAQGEFSLRYEAALEAVRSRRTTSAKADDALRPWFAIAAYFGADLPARVMGEDGKPPLWIDFYPPSLPANEASRAMASELRRATETIARRHHAAPQDEGLRDRCRALLALDRHLATMAGLPPFDAMAITQAKDERSAA